MNMQVNESPIVRVSLLPTSERERGGARGTAPLRATHTREGSRSLGRSDLERLATAMGSSLPNIATLVVPARKSGDDRARVFRRQDFSVIAIADGAGGVTGGARAAQLFVDSVAAVVALGRAPERAIGRAPELGWARSVGVWVCAARSVWVYFFGRVEKRKIDFVGGT